MPNKDKIGNIAIEQAIKIAKMKKDSMLANNLKSAVKSVIGSAHSMGVLVENKKSIEVNADIDAGIYDGLINEEKTEAPPEKIRQLNDHLKGIQEAYKAEMEKAKVEQEAKEAEKAAAAGAAPTEEKKETEEKSAAKEKPAKEEAKPSK